MTFPFFLLPAVGGSVVSEKSPEFKYHLLLFVSWTIATCQAGALKHWYLHDFQSAAEKPSQVGTGLIPPVCG